MIVQHRDGPFSIAVLRANDVARMRELNAVFAVAFCEGQPSAEAADDAYLERWLSNPCVVVLAAFRKTIVVGGLVAYVLERRERVANELYVYDLAVASAYRRRGLATALIQRIQRIARDKKIEAVYVQADEEDKAALALYGKFGAGARVQHFELL